MVANLSQAHSNMVVQQVRPSDVLDNSVLDVMADIPRINFLDASYADLAYADTELPIGFGQVMLAPTIQGRLLQSLRPTQTEQVIEIGTGTGYFTALLAKLAGSVVSVELYPELSKQAAEHLAHLNIDNVELKVGDASRGLPLDDRVDAIVVTAAFAILPDTYLHQLKVGGRMIAVVGKPPAMSVQLIKRVNEWEWNTETLFETVIPPIVNAEPKSEFQF